MANASTVVIGITFVDRDLNKAKVTMYLPFETPIDDCFVFANGAIDRLRLLTNALITKIQVDYRHTIDNPPEPGPESDTQRKVMLFVGNADEEINAVSIPSPRPIFEPAGVYAGIRIDRQHPAIIGFEELLLAQPLRTEDGRIFGSELLTGGLAL